MQKRPGSLVTALIATALSVAMCACSESGADGEIPSALPQVNAAANDQAPAATDVAGGGTADGASSDAATIAAGTEFSSATTATSLRMPDGITARLDDRSGTLSFANARNTLGGFVFGGSAGGSGSGASRAIRTLLPQLGLEIGEVFEDGVTPDGSTVSRFSAADRTGARVFLQLNVHQGPAGNYVAILGSSSIDEQSSLNAIVSAMSATVAFGTPPTPDLAVNLGGVVLESVEGGGSLIGDNSINYRDESSFESCTDGRYRFISNSITSLGFGNDGSGGTSSSLVHEGRFVSYVDFGGNQLITMESVDQGIFVMNVTLLDGAIFLDQTAYRQTGTTEAQCG